MPASVAPVSASEIYAVTSSYLGTSLFEFDGDSWRQDTSLSYVQAVATALSGDAIAIDSNGLHTRIGATWSIAAPGSPWGTMLWAASPTDVWVADLNSRLHHWDGATDSVCATCTLPFVTQLWGTSSNNVYAVRFGMLWHWDGTSWNDVTAPAVFHPIKLFGWAANDIIALDESSALWHFDGSTWKPMSYPFQVLRPQHMWGTSMSDLFLAADSAVFHYNGARWSPVKVPYTYWIKGVTGVGDAVFFFDIPVHQLIRTHRWD